MITQIFARWIRHIFRYDALARFHNSMMVEADLTAEVGRYPPVDVKDTVVGYADIKGAKNFKLVPGPF